MLVWIHLQHHADIQNTTTLAIYVQMTIQKKQHAQWTKVWILVKTNDNDQSLVYTYILTFSLYFTYKTHILKMMISSLSLFHDSILTNPLCYNHTKMSLTLFTINGILKIDIFKYTIFCLRFKVNVFTYIATIMVAN